MVPKGNYVYYIFAHDTAMVAQGGRLHLQPCTPNKKKKQNHYEYALYTAEAMKHTLMWEYIITLDGRVGILSGMAVTSSLANHGYQIIAKNHIW